MVLGFAIPAAAGENSKHDRDTSTLFALGEAPGGLHRALLAIDLERETTTVIGPATLPLGSLALAITPDGTAAYTIANAFSPANARLAKIDLATGLWTPARNPLGVDLKIMGMTFSPDGVLYAAGGYPKNSPNFNSLYKINLSSGLPTLVGSLGAGPNDTDFIMSFALDSHGNMYGASQTALYRIDPTVTTNVATKVVGFIGSSMVMGIAIDEDGNFYAADFVPDSMIYRLDVETGSLTQLFNTGIDRVHNIAFRP
jgi:DNA-binding beta-propeller fold protein YncE